VDVTESWWVFDRPLRRDPLFVVALLCGVAAAVGAVVTGGDVSMFVRVYEVVGGAVAGFSLFGIVGGSVRNFVRGYREGRPS
jgi:hypothetical protein